MNTEPNRISNKKVTRKQLLDILAIIVFTIFVYIYASEQDILERLVDFSMRHEKWELDEFLTVSVFLVFAMSVFALRRWHEVGDAIASLSRHNKELKKALSDKAP